MTSEADRGSGEIVILQLTRARVVERQRKLASAFAAEIRVSARGNNGCSRFLAGWRVETEGGRCKRETRLIHERRE